MSLQRFTSSLAIAAALTLGVGTAAQAHPGGNPHYQGPPPHAQAHGHKHGGWQQGHRPPPPRAHYYRGAGPQHRWVQGSRIPPQYRGSRYVVHDWRGHRLYQPPRGHQWVRYGGDYMLVAVASGVITQLLINGVR